MSTQQAGAKPRTTVTVSYAPFRMGNPHPGGCPVTIYTATGPRHPVLARVSERTMTGWVDRGEHYVNNWLVGSSGMPQGESFQFTFDCPAPEQYWEIHIETPAPLFPNYLDSMIGSCENRSFTIMYPGSIVRDSPHLQPGEDVFAHYVSKSTPPASGNASA